MRVPAAWSVTQTTFFNWPPAVRWLIADFDGGSAMYMNAADVEPESSERVVVAIRRKKNAANIDYEMSLEDVAAELGVSRERVFKIERSGLRKIRAILDAAERSAAWRDMIAS
jgi:hypothetical protein